jgi:hypothetical protein
MYRRETEKENEAHYFFQQTNGEIVDRGRRLYQRAVHGPSPMKFRIHLDVLWAGPGFGSSPKKSEPNFLGPSLPGPTFGLVNRARTRSKLTKARPA